VLQLGKKLGTALLIQAGQVELLVRHQLLEAQEIWRFKEILSSSSAMFSEGGTWFCMQIDRQKSQRPALPFSHASHSTGVEAELLCLPVCAEISVL
jgi:hypothetical protein